MTDEELKAIEARAATPISREAFIMGGPRAQGIVAEQHRRDAATLVAEVRRLRAAIALCDGSHLHADDCSWARVGRSRDDMHWNLGKEHPVGNDADHGACPECNADLFVMRQVAEALR